MNHPSSNRYYREIARRLGVTECGLTVLFRKRRGDRISGGAAGDKLVRDGFLTREGKLTQKGLETTDAARRLGY